MSKIKKVIIPAATLMALLAVGVIGTKVVGASDTDPLPIVQRLAETFGLEENEVQAVFEAVRDEKHEEIRRRAEDRLNQAVADGVLTQEQKEALVARHEKMLREREQHREEQEAWFKEQGIDETALRQYFGPHRHMMGK